MVVTMTAVQHCCKQVQHLASVEETTLFRDASEAWAAFVPFGRGSAGSSLRPGWLLVYKLLRRGCSLLISILTCLFLGRLCQRGARRLLAKVQVLQRLWVPCPQELLCVVKHTYNQQSGIWPRADCIDMCSGFAHKVRNSRAHMVHYDMPAAACISTAAECHAQVMLLYSMLRQSAPRSSHTASQLLQ